MKRAILALALALGLALAVVAPAAASRINLYQGCAYSSTSLRVSGGANTNQTVANPVRLGFGWAAQKQSQVQSFLNSQYATNIEIDTASGDAVNPVGNPLNPYPDETGVVQGVASGPTLPFETTWGQGGGSFWSPITAQTLIGRNGNPMQGYVSNYVAQFTLPDGQYYLSLNLGLKVGVNDGQNAANPGSWLTITNCPFTVTG